MKNANRAETSKEAKALTVVAKVENELRAKGKPNAATVEASSGALSGETVGLDVGDRVSQFCRLDAAGEIAEEGRLHTTAAGVEKHFAKLPAAVIALEAGTHSGWIARLPGLLERSLQDRGRTLSRLGRQCGFAAVICGQWSGAEGGLESSKGAWPEVGGCGGLACLGCLLRT